MDLNTRFHLQIGMQVCKGFGKKYAMAKIQISLVISKYLLDLFPSHPSAQYYVSSKCNKLLKNRPQRYRFPSRYSLACEMSLGSNPKLSKESNKDVGVGSCSPDISCHCHHLINCGRRKERSGKQGKSLTLYVINPSHP